MKRDFAYEGEICKIGNKTSNANKKYKENNNKMLSQFLRANSISKNLVPGNGSKNLIGGYYYNCKCTAIIV